MKKIFLFTITLLLFSITAVKAAKCNEVYNVTIDINGPGSVLYKELETNIPNDVTLKIACDEVLTLYTIPNEGYYAKTITSTDPKVKIVKEQDYYKVSNITSNLTLVAAFDIDESNLISDGTNSFTFIKDANKIVGNFNTSVVNISLFNLGDYINNSTILELNLKDINITIPTGILNLYKKDNIKISFSETSENILSNSQNQSIDASTYYSFNFAVNDQKVDFLNFDINIKIPYETEKSVELNYISNDAQTEVINSTYTNNSINFKTNKIGIYAVKLGDEKKDNNYSSSNGYDKIFTVIIVVGFVIYFIADYLKNKKKYNK